ncbi:5-dehydro-4-deoxyglucarate dehydratase [Corticibacter populi]|uniref:Probable 5-dehydro-4-deoxyglucarate dehydratase n=1 Tax=Corticibacter populi TaxID=1550736 RepID=A0A3M6R0R2_9BURK|nr:5-dehydro-4-deoxyglucarate dehydratase [Corticibacter populi]RMX08837.1 5-dehydro-4-deoxyglucarate dehydratase [Corticibacter populi]
MEPQILKDVMSSGLLSFPVTDFDKDLNFNPKGYAERLEWLAPFGASALFAAGGTGEFFSLDSKEYPSIIKTAVDTCKGKVPIIAGAGGTTRFAIECAQAAEKAGAHGILLLPHYLTEASQEGLAAHVEAVCKSVKFGVIIYNRGISKFKPETVARLAERNPNLVGFKDGVGDIEAMSAMYLTLGDRLAYLGGLPTAEVYAAAYKALGTPVYSSAVFNFIPATAIRFYEAVRDDDTATQHQLLKEFFLPYLAIRNRKEGYAVSIVKAGAKIAGHDAGPVRPPLSDLTGEEVELLAELVRKVEKA